MLYAILFTTFLLCSIGLTNGNTLRPGRLHVDILDVATGKLTPVRVRITNMGKPVVAIPDEAVAVSYGLWDHADGYAFQPDSSFYVAGSFNMTLPPGNYQLTLSKGNEYISQTHSLLIKPNQEIRQIYRLARWINMAARGWYSADDHIHIRRSPGENQPLLNWIQAEDINVGVLLKMGDFWETYYPQYAFGE